ncbi:MAG: beta-propeller repeat protein [Actinomycetia bacterium]|nr:beta-propeller repeat protein [Actinomycetes bacterium]
MRRPIRLIATAVAGLMALPGCQTVPFRSDPRGGGAVLGLGGPAPYLSPRPTALSPRPTAPKPPPARLEVADPNPDVYAATRTGMFSRAVHDLPARVYVPNGASGTVDVIDPATYAIVGHFTVGRAPQHIAPSWDLGTLWLSEADGLVPVDPRTGRPGAVRRMAGADNFYFTPDGRYTLVMSGQRVDVRYSRTLRLQASIPMPCKGVNSADFTADGTQVLVSCELDGQLVRLDPAQGKVTGVLGLRRGALPQDVRLSPDGAVFYVSDMAAGGVWVVDAVRLRRLGFVRTGKGAHGLYPSRDGKLLYVANRGEGTISLISFATRAAAGKWRLPGGSPDMGGVSADGSVLWLSGRYDGSVYAISTVDGRLLRRIRVGRGPHGLCVYPQPGRYSIGPILR